ncbi:hypothetical protein Pres01_28870 [Metapseudomonas resinovorans]|nr:hypothetical protein Pres01_28870 [Pseudomonas resinovorans]
MIELLVERLEDCLELGEVTNPAGVGIGLAFDIDSHTERVAVKATALVASGHVRKPVRGFEYEFLENFHRSNALEVTARDLAKAGKPRF